LTLQYRHFSIITRERGAMKTGMNLLLWTTHVTAEHFPIFSKLRAEGFDGVEIPLFEGDATHYRKVRAELDRNGLSCTAVTVVGPDHSPISPDANIRSAAADRLKWAIEMASIIGAENLCGPFHSPLAVFSGEPPTEGEKSRAVDVLRQAAEFASGAKVRLTIEYLNRFECYFLTTAADAVALVHRVNHPNFRTMFDSFHAHIEEKSQSGAIYQVAPVLGHVHISENDRGIPGTGQVAWDCVFSTLRKIGYDGWLVIEAFGRALPALAAATRVWRDLFPRSELVHQQGLAFIRKKWAEHATL
jgi:D-psicose/D-tagatose/L-ribulose 3-epimerase